MENFAKINIYIKLNDKDYREQGKAKIQFLISWIRATAHQVVKSENNLLF